MKVNTLAWLMAVVAMMQLLIGCWNYNDLDNLSIVLGVAVDYEAQDEMVTVTLEVISVARPGPDAEMESEFIRTQGTTFMGAARKALAQVGRELLWSHTRVLLLSEEVTRKGAILSGVLDFFARHPHARDDALLMVSLEADASDILEGIDTRLESINSIYLSQILLYEHLSSEYISIPLWRFVNDAHQLGTEPIAPAVRMMNGNDSTLAEISGTGVFAGKTLVGWLDERETESFSFITNRVKRGVVSLRRPQGDVFSLRVLSSATKMTPSYTDGQLHIAIHVDTEFSLWEYGNHLQTLEMNQISALETEAGGMMKRKMEAVITKVQREFGTDIFGFGQAVERKHPGLWSEVSSQWNRVFPTLEVDVSVNFSIRRGGLKEML